jgi:hypothetical protein
MNQLIEDYLAGLVENAALEPKPEVFTGTSAAIRSPESHAVLVLADDIENVVGPLHRATVKLSVSSPTDDRAGHAALARAVKALLASPLPAANGFSVAGVKIGTSTTGVTDDNRWLSSTEALLGIVAGGG